VSAARVAGLAVLLALPVLAGAGDLGREVFTEKATPPCAICHTLEAAGATGEVGPSLDELKPSKSQILEAVRTGVGVMPRYTGLLSEEQIEAVAEFVHKSTGGN
jgi:cytochrome c6